MNTFVRNTETTEAVRVIRDLHRDCLIDTTAHKAIPVWRDRHPIAALWVDAEQLLEDAEITIGMARDTMQAISAGRSLAECERILHPRRYYTGRPVVPPQPGPQSQTPHQEK